MDEGEPQFTSDNIRRSSRFDFWICIEVNDYNKSISSDLYRTSR